MSSAAMRPLGAGRNHPAAPYVAPFLVFVLFLAAHRFFPGSEGLLYLGRFIAVALCLAVVSRRVIPVRTSHPWASIALGIAVFAIWIGPDALWPGYRGHWLFSNAVMGEPASTIPAALKSNAAFVAMRSAGSIVLVPLLEELFWRGWMMRWLIQRNFLGVPFGKYHGEAFWVVALLFASEHGPYWEVGLLAGIAYNWWAVRTRNLADCILAHAVTNACLSAYVIGTGNWQYWL
ncbi:MAG: CAAX prenyl protease-related protein [Bryobacteraceae bacterium]